VSPWNDVAARAADGASAADPSIVAADEAHRAAMAGEATLYDIRTPQEWTMTGVPQGAERLSLQDPRFGETLLARLRAEPATPVILICASGGRTGQVLQQLSQMGLSGARHVAEGVSGSPAGPGWLARGLPLERGDGA
ncbi:MAG: rhodanese-like domain-containing protein, partial [Pseudomonadota bacterium]